VEGAQNGRVSTHEEGRANGEAPSVNGGARYQNATPTNGEGDVEAQGSRRLDPTRLRFEQKPQVA